MRLRRTLTLAVAALAAVGTACASGGSGSISGSTITAAQLEPTPFSNAYEVLDGHRLVEFQGGEAYLRGRGETTFMARPTALLVVDGSHVTSGAAAVLASLEKDVIARIDIMRPSEAAQRFGGYGEGGAIVVQLQRR